MPTVIADTSQPSIFKGVGAVMVGLLSVITTSLSTVTTLQGGRPSGSVTVNDTLYVSLVAYVCEGFCKELVALPSPKSHE